VTINKLLIKIIFIIILEKSPMLKEIYKKGDVHKTGARTKRTESRTNPQIGSVIGGAHPKHIY